MSANGVLDIRLLGRPNVNAHGAPVKFARRNTTITMLALLILRRNQPVARSFLAFTLFPDHDEEQALNELRRYLYLAVKALPPTDAEEPWLTVDAETVRWNDRSGAFVDVIEYERLARAGASHAEAVELYAGDLLEEVYDDWVVVERERLRSSFLTILSDLVERYRSARDYPQALAFANRLLIADPWREDVIRQIIGIRYASGDAPGALATYDRFVKQLRDEMGVAPMPETVLVREAVLLGRPLIGSVDRPPAGEGGAKTHVLPFVGREHEREILHSRWDRAARGSGNSLFVGGEAGAGKTRLVGESARVVESEGGRVFSGGTSSPESSPYQCITEALRSALTLLTANPSNNLIISVLARVFPELQNLSDTLPRIGVLPADREAARLFEAFGAAVAALAVTRPVLLVLEDLHWASPSTIDAVAAICRRVDRARVLIVVTYREEEVPATHPLRRLLNALGIEQRMTDIHLGRLSRDHVEQLIRANDVLAQVDAGLIDRLYAFSEGNALFLNEAIADALERLDKTVPHAEHRAIESIVASRIGRLSDAAQMVAEIAAVCGHGCSIDTIRNVSGLEMSEIYSGFDELLDRQLVREAWARDQYDFMFTHNLIRTSIYERIDESVRKRRHARIARVIEKRETILPGDARELARHYEIAGLPQAASRWYARAAREAAVLYANDDALVFATRALDCTDDPELTIEALLIREEVNARLGSRVAQAHDLALLQHLVTDVEMRCHVGRRVVLALRVEDDREAERTALVDFGKSAARSAYARWRGVVHSADAQFHLSIGKYGEAKALALKALPYLQTVDATRDRLEAFSMLIEAQVALGELGDAEHHLETVHQLALAAGDLTALCDALMRAVSAATVKQEFERAANGAKEALVHFRVIGDRLGEASALSSVAMACVRLSRWDEARSANLAAAEICESVGERRGLARAQMNLAMLHARFGDLEVARDHLLSARAHHDMLGDRRAHTASLLNESFVAIWQNCPGEAKSLALKAVAAAKEMDHAAYLATALANLGAAERDLGELDAAIEHMEEGLAMQLALNRMADGVSDLADIALAYALRGDLTTAQTFAERISAIETSWTDSAIFPPYPLWIVACIFYWNHDERADVMRAWAWQLAESLAESISEPALSAKFKALPFYVTMRQIDGTRGWPSAPAFTSTRRQVIGTSRRQRS
jgi:predicted ATPase/DNA-binding SARP family transcriptional activator